jgi:hypothetical protein
MCGIPGGYEENGVIWMWKDSEIFLGRIFYNSMEVRLGHDLAAGGEWVYYSLNRLDITNFKLTKKFKIADTLPQS